MRRSLLLLMVAVLIGAACGNSDQGVDTSNDGGVESPTGELMAAALQQVVTVDHTFGGGPPPFSRYLVQAATDPQAGDGSGSGARPLTGTERDAIAAALDSLGPVEFIDDPDDWRTSDLVPTIEGSVILGVGEPTIEDGSALVPVSLWCGGLCGTWLTYRVELDDGNWTVTGIEGPIAIS